MYQCCPKSKYIVLIRIICRLESSSKSRQKQEIVVEEGDSFKSENEKEIIFQSSHIMSVEVDQQHIVVNQTSQNIKEASQPPLIVLVKNARSENNLN